MDDTALIAQPLLAPATFLGYLDLECDVLIEMWNLTEDIPGHPEGSIVSRRTLEQAGYIVPPPGAAPGDRSEHGRTPIQRAP